MALKPTQVKSNTVTDPVETEAAAETAAAAETEADPLFKTARPVMLKAAQYRITNPYSLITYYPSRATPLLDLNAADAYFERAQVDAGVLLITQEGLPHAD